MKGPRRERLVALVRTLAWDRLYPIRRQVLSAGALLFAVASVLLVLDAVLPFPPPSERILLDPSDWSLVFHRDPPPPVRAPAAVGAGEGMGGMSTVQPPVAVLLYRAQPGDTMSGIATRLGMDVDTISSMNRVEGRGVHNISVGEIVKVPSQNGIPLAAAADFDAQCKGYGVSPEDVLAANAISRAQLQPGMSLFFPGVQHTGYARSLAVGVGVALPIRGWESSPFGWRLDPFTGQRSHHSGVDIAAPEGSAIRSATSGVVIAATYDSMLGNYVQVAAQLGYSYVYGHMSSILTHVGAKVARGDVLGLVGHTGYATGPHLHFEVRLHGVPQNPRNYLPGIR
ncbi:MAG TPA: M23 family metallopeptidase [Spirochaetia bacterium]|nr:M23 family metallopeptidase [Spirochaetia bacterium]